MKALLAQYSLDVPPLVLPLEFTPEKLQRSRTVKVTNGASAASRLGYDFTSPLDTARVAQGVQLEPETLTLDTMFDVTNRLAEGDLDARLLGVRPELDILRSMVMPKVTGPAGMRLLAGIGQAAGGLGAGRESPSVMLFVWGPVVLPVFVTGFTERAVLHTPALVPIRAEVTITLQVIESRNPFTIADRARQVSMASVSLARSGVSAVQSWS